MSAPYRRLSYLIADLVLFKDNSLSSVPAEAKAKSSIHTCHIDVALEQELSCECQCHD